MTARRSAVLGRAHRRLRERAREKRNERRRERIRELDLDSVGLDGVHDRVLSWFGGEPADVVLECAGHRRVEFERLSTGLPWAAGAVAEARWTGPSLRSVLDLVGIPTDAREVVLEGADSGPVEGVDGGSVSMLSVRFG